MIGLLAPRAGLSALFALHLIRGASAETAEILGGGVFSTMAAAFT
jgi:hypothetical protein